MIRAFLAGLRDGLPAARSRRRGAGPVMTASATVGGLARSMFGLDQTGATVHPILDYANAQLVTLTGGADTVTLGAVGHVCVEFRTVAAKAWLRADGQAAATGGSYAREYVQGMTDWIALPPGVTTVSLFGTAGDKVQVMPALAR